MLSKRSFIIILLLVLAGGGYYFMRGSAPSTPAAESHGAEDGHGHEEKAEKPGHDEGGKEEAGHKEEGHKEEGHKEEGHAEGEGKEEHGEGTALSKESAEAAGVKTEEAGSSNINETIKLTGRTTLNQNTTAQVKARFPGIVREVKKGPGEMVASGDVLATVESNESLQVYPVKSPINGVILTRSTNVGDVAGDAPMFTITDTSDIWAEFHVFPRDIDRIKVGQKVLITSFEGGHTGEAVISTLLPIAESSSQTVIARVTLPNPEGLWRAGMTVRGDVVIAERQVPVAVKTAAIQRMEGKIAVFVEEGERYETRPIRTGISDSTWTEVLEGLKAGERYVSERSFQIKADIGKAGAAHEH
jgi:cobalt-zinc-cadmium efflux system membrane fusion protein